MQPEYIHYIDVLHNPFLSKNRMLRRKPKKIKIHEIISTAIEQLEEMLEVYVTDFPFECVNDHNFLISYRTFHVPFLLLLLKSTQQLSIRVNVPFKQGIFLLHVHESHFFFIVTL